MPIPVNAEPCMFHCLKCNVTYYATEDTWVCFNCLNWTCEDCAGTGEKCPICGEKDKDKWMTVREIKKSKK